MHIDLSQLMRVVYLCVVRLLILPTKQLPDVEASCWPRPVQMPVLPADLPQIGHI